MSGDVSAQVTPVSYWQLRTGAPQRTDQSGAFGVSSLCAVS